MRRTGRRVHGVVAAAAALAAAGCVSTGLSPRDSTGRGYAQYLYALPPQTASDGAPGPVTLRVPASVAVAQVGEVAPPDAVLEQLRERPELFARIEPVAALWELHPHHADQTAGRDQVRELAELTRGMGMDYLLLLGGTIDYDTNTTGLTLLDVTVVGAFVVPSREVRAEGKASAALVDLRTNRVVLTASAQEEADGRITTVNRDSGELRVLEGLRDELVVELSAQLIARCEAMPRAAPL